MDEAARLHAALSKVSERLASVLEGALFERRDGYELMVFPPLPLASFNGVWVETEAAAVELENAIAEVERRGLPFGATVRSGRTPTVEKKAAQLGLTASVRIPGMVATPEDLPEAPESELEIIRVETADGLAQALSVAAIGFEAPTELLAS